MDDLIKKIRKANPKRKVANMTRRILKVGEEYGEAAQAYLSVTSKANSKKKSWADVREELTDIIIVAMDVLLTTFPDEDKKMTDEEKDAIIHKELDRKLQKWLDKVKTTPGADKDE
jgi:NTP pyrophosphatase (non-canonical NTP hydrolase)